MPPRIIVLSGSLKGMVLPIEANPVSVGRDSSNTLCLADPVISLRHFSITKPNGAYELVDHSGDNSTYVNGIQVARKTLVHGDTIRIGSSELLFAIHGEDTSPGRNPDPPANASVSEVKSLHVDKTMIESGFDIAVGRMARDLTALLRISGAINSLRDIGHLQGEVLCILLEVIPADDAAVVLVAASEEQPSIYAWNRRSGETSLSVQMNIVSKAFWERSAAVVSLDPEIEGSRHVLCVPLVAVQRTLGVLYLSSSQRNSPFFDDHIHFLVSASWIVAVALENLLTLNALSNENRELKEKIFSTRLVGESAAIKKVEAFISRVAPEDATVLIRGESGTGKELVARAIHHNSPRADRPFVAINCAAIPETLLESELFGHEKGAFTGAAMQKKGKLELAEDGTLFLDEIGELAPLLQAKLLRALQQREFERLGGNRTLRFTARVIAATNKDLEKAIKSGEFRQDLYYRLNVISVKVPALRERRHDIPVLALHFASKYSPTRKRPFTGISADARAILMNYSWPGNVRELENAIEHAMVLGVSEEILPEDLPGALLEEQSARVERSRYHTVINNTKKDLVLDALRTASGSFPEAAKLLGIHPKYLFRLVRNLKLRTDSML